MTKARPIILLNDESGLILWTHSDDVSPHLICTHRFKRHETCLTKSLWIESQECGSLWPQERLKYALLSVAWDGERNTQPIHLKSRAFAPKYYSKQHNLVHHQPWLSKSSPLSRSVRRETTLRSTSKPIQAKTGAGCTMSPEQSWMAWITRPGKPLTQRCCQNMCQTPRNRLGPLKRKTWGGSGRNVA